MMNVKCMVDKLRNKFEMNRNRNEVDVYYVL